MPLEPLVSYLLLPFLFHCFQIKFGMGQLNRNFPAGVEPPKMKSEKTESKGTRNSLQKQTLSYN